MKKYKYLNTKLGHSLAEERIVVSSPRVDTSPVHMSSGEGQRFPLL